MPFQTARPVGPRLVAGGLVLLLDAMAACPDLHEMIHHDADERGHQCVATLFAHGQVDSPVVEVAAIIPVTPVVFFPLTSVSVINVLVETLPLGRGPPVFPFNSKPFTGLRRPDFAGLLNLNCFGAVPLDVGRLENCEIMKKLWMRQVELHTKTA